MTMIEERLEAAGEDVRRATAGMPTHLAGRVAIRHRHQRVAVSFAALATIGGGWFALAQAVAHAPEVGAPPPVAVSPADQPGPATTAPVVEESAVAEFWGEMLGLRVDVVGRWGIFGTDESEPGARVVEYQVTGDPLGGEGSMVATVVSADDQLTVRAEYRAPSKALDESDFDVEFAELAADDTTRHLETTWHAPGMDEELSGEGEKAELFLTELEPGSAQITVLTALGRLVVQVDAADPTLIFDHDQLTAIATGMIGTALDLIWNPDQALTLIVEPLPEPTDEQWIPLSGDLWIASVNEGDNVRLWVRTDVQEPTPAAATAMRSINAFTGNDLIVIVVGEPVPDAVTVTWDDGSAETAELDWDAELDLGFARFQARPAGLVSVDGP